MGIFFPLVIFYLTSTLSFSAAAAGKSSELATEVCKKTTSFAFCHEVIYSDPRAPEADANVLSYIAFGRTFSNATQTQKYISATLKSINPSSKIYKGIKKCEIYYSKAIRALTEALGNLDSETYDGMDKLAIEVGEQARACESSFHGHSPITKKNTDLIKLSNICLVVSKLYSID